MFMLSLKSKHKTYLVAIFCRKSYSTDLLQRNITFLSIQILAIAKVYGSTNRIKLLSALGKNQSTMD